MLIVSDLSSFCIERVQDAYQMPFPEAKDVFWVPKVVYRLIQYRHYVTYTRINWRFGFDHMYSKRWEKHLLVMLIGGEGRGGPWGRRASSHSRIRGRLLMGVQKYSRWLRHIHITTPCVVLWKKLHTIRNWHCSYGLPRQSHLRSSITKNDQLLSCKRDHGERGPTKNLRKEF